MKVTIDISKENLKYLQEQGSDVSKTLNKLLQEEKRGIITLPMVYPTATITKSSITKSRSGMWSLGIKV